jgi:hypothetical protein
MPLPSPVPAQPLLDRFAPKQSRCTVGGRAHLAEGQRRGKRAAHQARVRSQCVGCVVRRRRLRRAEAAARRGGHARRVHTRETVRRRQVHADQVAAGVRGARGCEGVHADGAVVGERRACGHPRRARVSRRARCTSAAGPGCSRSRVGVQLRRCVPGLASFSASRILRRTLRRHTPGARRLYIRQA